MIVDMPNTTASKIGKRLNELRETGGVVALGRVLTLIISAEEDRIETAISAANGASRLHPARIIVLADENALRAFVAERLAAFKVPVRVLFSRETLPRNANGKILKNEVKKFFD